MTHVDGLRLVVGIVVATAWAGRVAAESVGYGYMMPEDSAPMAMEAGEPAVAVAMASVEGMIVLKQDDAMRGVSYLRVEDHEGRVWIMEINDSTSISDDSGKADSKSLIKGLRVQATFPRAHDSTPVASSVSILVP